jgi:ATP-binding cassette, subfamily C, bacterial CydC
VAAPRRSRDPGRSRAAVRVELLGAVDAWPELASMGAADQLVARTVGRVAAFERREQRQQTGIALARGLARVVTAVALLLVVLLAARTGATAPTLVMVALVAAGVLATCERLVAAGDAWVERRQAQARLAAADEPRQPDPQDSPDLRIRYDARGLTVGGYLLPETPTRRARVVELAAAPGSTLVVHGASGSGKTTLLSAIATALPIPETAPKVVLVRAEDHLFTGTVAGNIRLADPDASDFEIAALLEELALGRAGLEPGTPVGVGGRDLSGGEQRRLHLARALAACPDVLLVDEPTTALDPVTAEQVLTAVRRRLPRAVLVLAMHVPQGGSLLDPTWSTISLD